MDSPKLSSIVLFPVCALLLLCPDSFDTAITSVCINKPSLLNCQAQDPPFTWKYKGFKDDVFQKIGISSKNEAQLSSNKPKKFENNTTIFSNGSLSMSSVSMNHSGSYVCQSQSGYNNLQTVLVVDCEKNVCEGDNVTIDCDLLKYKDDIGLKSYAEIVWKTENEKLFSIGPDMKVMYKNPEYPNIGVEQEALKIESVSKEFNGQRFTCVVHGQNGVTPREYSVVLKIQERQTTVGEVASIEPTGHKKPNSESQLQTHPNPKPADRDGEDEESDHDEYIRGTLLFLFGVVMVFVLPLTILAVVSKLRNGNHSQEQRIEV